MSTPILDISDSNLQLWSGGEPLRSPGYALLEGNSYRFGNPARAAARRRPRDINTRFWWQLNTEPLQPALGPARHSADIVHAHLLDIHRQGGEPDELLLAVSGSMPRQQLSLLLGIVQACPFNAVGLVNRSALLGSLHGGPGRLFHLEIQLHQAVLTELGDSDGKAAIQHTTPLPGCGLLQLQERLVEIIASGFIRQTRFDPRRKADTEQDLYDKLPQALRALDTVSETNLEVNGYSARLNRSDLTVAGERLFRGLTETIGTPEADDHVLLDPIATLLPGLSGQLPAVTRLQGDALWQAAQGHGDALVQRAEHLDFITALPWLARREGSTSTIAPTPLEPASVSPPSPATHLLCDGQATSLTADTVELAGACELYKENGQWLLRGSGSATVDGAPYRPQRALRPGELIACGGAVYQLIEVLR